jgi:FkbH-like protein
MTSAIVDALNMESTRLRNEADELIAAGNAGEAARRLAELLRADGGSAAASFAVSRYERLRGQLPLVPYRVALLRSFTLEPLVPLLRAACFAAGIDIAVHVGDFNAYAQEMLDPDSTLYRFAPDAVILAAQTRDLAPDLWHDFPRLEEDERRVVTARVSGNFHDCINAFLQHGRAHLILHALEEPAAPGLGLLDNARDANGQLATVRRINDELRRLASTSNSIHLLEYDALIARHGRAHWHDERKWLAARMPLAAGSLPHLVKEWMRFLRPLTGRVAKVVAVDLDNTLWGGVVGEDGIGGLKLGAEYGGAAYVEVQRALLDLKARGLLLCLCSKNNPAEAVEAIETHPAMLLHMKDFAAARVNWNDKAESLRELAAELNIGIDAFAFVDDNPVEREHVRAQLPEVHVVELPASPEGFARALREEAAFERLTLSDEDRARTGYYAAERERAALQGRTTTREDFLRSLAQEAEVSPVTRETLARAAQLTQKTNQFNLTTRRYTEQQLADLLSRADWHACTMRLRDRFGDNGIVGLALARTDADAWELDSFLLSCRVIGRTVETALLAHLVETARAQGATRLVGRYLPTRKNAPAKDFYVAHGFALVSEQADGGSLWSLDLARQTVECPAWIRLVARKVDEL